MRAPRRAPRAARPRARRRPRPRRAAAALTGRRVRARAPARRARPRPGGPAERSSLRKKISDAVSQLAWECAEASSAAHAQAAIAAQQAGQPEPPPPPPLGWEGLLPFVLRCATSGNAGLHEAAMHILAELAGPLARPALRDARPTLQQTLARSLAEGESTAVRVAAVQAVAAVVQALGSAAERAPYAELVPHMLAVVSTALNASAEDEARDALETFVELSENCPRFLKPHASALVHALLAVASAAQLDEPTRHLAFECMLTLAEAAPAIVKKIDGFPAAVLPLALRMMLEVCARRAPRGKLPGSFLRRRSVCV